MFTLARDSMGNLVKGHLANEREGILHGDGKKKEENESFLVEAGSGVPCSRIATRL